jgi:hypothetical protein
VNRGPARTLRSIWRAWHGTTHLALGGAAVVVLRLWSGPIDVPGRDIAQVTAPLVPAFLALACLIGARTAHHPGERITPRGAVVVRVGYLATLGGFAAVLLAASGSDADRWVLARNDALMCGLALLALELLPAAMAWTPLVLVPMLTWLLGSNGLGVAPEPWAVLLEPAGSTSAACASLAIVTAGTLVYLGGPWGSDLRRAHLQRRRARPALVSGARSG